MSYRNEPFEPQGYKIASRDLPKVVVWVGKFFSTMMKDLYHTLGKNLKLMISNKRMVSELGIQPRPVEESIIDVCYNLIDLGLVLKEDSWISWTSVKETTGGQNLITSLHEGVNSLNRAEVNHAPRSYVYTMGQILYRQIPRWLMVQLVNSSRRYVSPRPVRRLLNQELLEFIVF